MFIESVMPSNHLILCCPLVPPSIFPSIRVFSNESVLPIRWPKYWSFRFSISPSNEYSGLISFRIDWLYLLEVQGTLKSLLQHRSSKASILRHSAFFIVQLSHPYMTTGKTVLYVSCISVKLEKIKHNRAVLFLPCVVLSTELYWRLQLRARGPGVHMDTHHHLHGLKSCLVQYRLLSESM